MKQPKTLREEDIVSRRRPKSPVDGVAKAALDRAVKRERRRSEVLEIPRRRPAFEELDCAAE